MALLSVDLEDVASVGESRGRRTGEQLLFQLADRLSDVEQVGELIVRPGGEELMLLLADIDADPRGPASRAADSVAQRLREPFVVEDTQVRIHPNIGISVYPDDARDAASLLEHADAAMFQARRAGGRHFAFYSAAPDPDAERSPKPSTGPVFSPPPQRPSPILPPRVPGDPAVVQPEDLAEVTPFLRVLVRAILRSGAVQSTYQPLVDLDSGDVVGYEALARGPGGSSLRRRDLMFLAAEAEGRLAELDWLCGQAALADALQAGMARPLTLSFNMEPATLLTPVPEPMRAVWERGLQELDVVVEIPERAFLAQPAELLRIVDGVRERGWGIALDDVGADPRSLALVPLIRPDLVKLDLRLLDRQPPDVVAAVVHAVNAQQGQSGTVVLVEGIEREDQVLRARSMGATLGQGWLFGRPGPLPWRLPQRRGTVEIGRTPRVRVDGRTPYEVVTRAQGVRRADKGVLLKTSLHLERQAETLGYGAVLLAAFQTRERFTPGTELRYAGYAERVAFVAAFGIDMEPEPVPGIRGGQLDPGDPLVGEWDVLVLGPHFAAALVAIDLGDDGPDHQRRFDFAVTYDRELVLAAAHTLLARIEPRPEGPPIMLLGGDEEDEVAPTPVAAPPAPAAPAPVPAAPVPGPAPVPDRPPVPVAAPAAPLAIVPAPPPAPPARRPGSPRAARRGRAARRPPAARPPPGTSRCPGRSSTCATRAPSRRHRRRPLRGCRGRWRPRRPGPPAPRHARRARSHRVDPQPPRTSPRPPAPPWTRVPSRRGRPATRSRATRPRRRPLGGGVRPRHPDPRPRVAAAGPAPGAVGSPPLTGAGQAAS